MKLNKSYFMGLFITFLMVGIAGIVAGVAIVTNPDSEILHRGRLHTLYFGNFDDVGIKVQSGASYLSVLNGLIVGVNVSASNASGSMIGGGERNNIESQNAGIAGGQSNQIYPGGDYSAIGGGRNNRIGGENSIIAGGLGNESHGGVIIGGEGNWGYDGGIILGGQGNQVYDKNSLVMGSGAISYEGSLVWNDGSAEYSENVPENSARIDASNGVLIGTNQSTTGVRLVVNGAVKLGSENGNFAGEMSVDGNGCIWASDGVTGHVLGKGSESECTVVTGCLFGSTLIQNGDKVTAYVKPYSTDCTGLEAREIMCNGSELCLSNGTECGHSYDKYYPYCYKISDPSNNREYPGRSSFKKTTQYAREYQGQKDITASMATETTTFQGDAQFQGGTTFNP